VPEECGVGGCDPFFYISFIFTTEDEIQGMKLLGDRIVRLGRTGGRPLSDCGSRQMCRGTQRCCPSSSCATTCP